MNDRLSHQSSGSHSKLSSGNERGPADNAQSRFTAALFKKLAIRTIRM